MVVHLARFHTETALWSSLGDLGTSCFWCTEFLTQTKAGLENSSPAPMSFVTSELVWPTSFLILDDIEPNNSGATHCWKQCTQWSQVIHIKLLLPAWRFWRGKIFSERRKSLTLESNHKTNYASQELTWVAITKTELSQGSKTRFNWSLSRKKTPLEKIKLLAILSYASFLWDKRIRLSGMTIYIWQIFIAL